MRLAQQIYFIIILIPFSMTVLNAESVDEMPISFKSILSKAKRIPTSDGWFEIIKLPNNVYALFEPGHAEQVNSFLILGQKHDLLYDTGMGIASIRNALVDLKKAEGLSDKKLIVLNSHAHLDHIGGNHEFEQVYAYDHPWRLQKLTMGIPGGEEFWIPYFSDLTGKPNAPKGFDPNSHSIAGITKENIKLFEDGHVFDLGNRKLKVTVSRSHTEESVILYDAENRMLFTGDVFVPGYFYVLDFQELEKDLKMLAQWDVNYHYNTHGDQLIDLELRRETLSVVEKINRGEVKPGKKELFGDKQTVYELEGMYFWYMPDLLMY